MIPYLPQPKLHLFGNVTYSLFGLLVIAGTVLGVKLVYHRTARAGIEKTETTKVLWVVLVCGFLVSHLVHVFFYYPQRINREGLLVLLKIWDGMSSLGGFLGSFLAIPIIFKRLKKKAWIMIDSLTLAIIIGWIFGRLGCTFAHDHPGRLTDFFLAFDYPAGSRHNLGFYEFLYTVFVLLPSSIFLQSRKPQPGTLAALACLLYSPFRFALDFLRATDLPGADIRYLGLTFAQYGCIFLFFLGIWLFFRFRTSLA